MRLCWWSMGVAEGQGVDVDKLRQKAALIREKLRLLREVRKEGREAFLESSTAEAATTRYLQIAIESVVDVAHHLIARKGWGLPKTYQEAIDLAMREGFLPAERAEAFRRLVTFRNRAVHLYDMPKAGEVWDVLENYLEDLDTVLGAVATEYLGGS